MIDNRFEVLKADTRPPRRYTDYRHDPYFQPHRCGRGSREGKRRRDEKRNRRKLAAVRMIDEQLSRDLDRTLTKANIRSRSPQLEPLKPAKELPANGATSPQPIFDFETSSESTYFNFRGLGPVGRQPQLNTQLYSPTPMVPPIAMHPSSVIPSWYPAMPTCWNTTARQQQPPLFFDLSKLPEPIELPESMSCEQDIQVWRPNVRLQPKAELHSHSLITPEKGLRPVNTACKLHSSDRGYRDAATQTDESVFHKTTPDVKQTDATEDSFDALSAASPADLWSILSVAQEPHFDDQNNSYIASLTESSAEDQVDTASVLLATERDISGKRHELADTEILFVHANSLTGHANQRGTFPIPDSKDGVIYYNSVGHASRAQEFLFGLNELVVDQYMEEGYADAVIAALDLPPLPPSPEPVIGSRVLPTASSALHTGRHDEEQFDHYPYEAPFSQPPSPILMLTDEDIVDVALLLEAIHSPDCWCEGCNDPPELIDDDSLADAEDEWMDLLTLNASPSPSVSSA